MNISVGNNIGGMPKLPNGRHMVSHGTYIYTKNGLKHRENGPAEVRRDGYQAYYTDGVKDRKGAPAVIRPDGIVEYWEKGKFIKREKVTNG